MFLICTVSRNLEAMVDFSVRVHGGNLTFLIIALGHKPTPHTTLTHQTSHNTPNNDNLMVVESEGGKGYNSGGQDREWMGCLITNELQQRRSRSRYCGQATRHAATHHTSHVIPHTTVYDRRARGG